VPVEMTALILGVVGAVKPTHNIATATDTAAKQLSIPILFIFVPSELFDLGTLLK
jgi:hypothetical protein